MVWRNCQNLYRSWLSSATITFDIKMVRCTDNWYINFELSSFCGFWCSPMAARRRLNSGIDINLHFWFPVLNSAPSVILEVCIGYWSEVVSTSTNICERLDGDLCKSFFYFHSFSFFLVFKHDALILRVSQLQIQQVMTSQIRSHRIFNTD